MGIQDCTLNVTASDEVARANCGAQVFLARHAQCLQADGERCTEPAEASGWPSRDALWLSILEATKTGVAANKCIRGRRGGQSQSYANKEKREMLWEEVTFREAGSS